MPIILQKADSEPEPDLIIALGVLTYYIHRHSAADDILLLVDISKRTLRKYITENLEL